MVRGRAGQLQPGQMWNVRIVINMLNSSEHWLFYWSFLLGFTLYYYYYNASALLKVLSHTTSDMEINIPCFFLFDPVTKRYSTSVCHASIYRVVFGTPVHTCIFVSPPVHSESVQKQWLCPKWCPMYNNSALCRKWGCDLGRKRCPELWLPDFSPLF